MPRFATQSSVITYARPMATAPAIDHELNVGPRVRALREAMDLSLRELAVRSGVSAQMLSQVERGETSPTLSLAARIATGLELTLSQLLRLDEGGSVTVVAQRGAPRRRRRGARPQLRDPHPAAARAARRGVAAHAGARRGHRRPERPADARARQPRDRGRHRRRARAWSATGPAHDLATGDAVTFDADLPHHFENPRTGRRPLPRGRGRRTQEVLMPQDAAGQDLGPPRGARRAHLHRPAPGARGHERAGLRVAAAGRAHGAPARPHARHRRPQRAHRRRHGAARWSATRCRASRSARSRRTAPSSASRSTRSARSSQGIVHVIGPELGVTQPGMTIVCGDSHTSTHGAFGALAFGIGTSEVEHVLATQTLQQRKPRSMRISYSRRARRRASPPRT